MNNLATGKPIPYQWDEGSIVHIYKKNDPQECDNYRPIFLTQIIYKIRPSMITKRLSIILHMLANNAQYGYRAGVFEIDAITPQVKLLQENPHKNTIIILMALSKAFGAVNAEHYSGPPCTRQVYR